MNMFDRSEVPSTWRKLEASDSFEELSTHVNPAEETLVGVVHGVHGVFFPYFVFSVIVAIPIRSARDFEMSQKAKASYYAVPNDELRNPASLLDLI